MTPVNISRRKFMNGLEAVAAGAAISFEPAVNYYRLTHTKGADYFEAPVHTRNRKAIDSIIEGEEVDAHLLNFYAEGDKPGLDYSRIEEEVEDRLGDLEEVDMPVEFHDVPIPGDMVERFREDVSQTGPKNLNPEYLEVYADRFLEIGKNSIDDRDIKVYIADFGEGSEGASRHGDKAIVNRMSEGELIGTITHDIGHELGLPHTYHPDIDRGGVIPDIMSYSPLRSYEEDGIILSFEQQSHYNWEKVREHHLEN